MSLSDKFRSFLGKDGEPSGKPENSTPQETTPSAKKSASIGQTGTPSPASGEARPAGRPAPKSVPPPKAVPTLEELDAMMAKERSDGEAQLEAVEKEIQGLRV